MLLTFGLVRSKPLPECAFGDSQDCDGDDMIKINGTTTTMTPHACCDLCRKTKGCKVDPEA